MTLAGRLRQILPAGIVLTDSDALECYGQDETEDLVFKPAVVVKPVNTVQVVEVMRFAHQDPLSQSCSEPLHRRDVHTRCNLGGRHRWAIESGFLVEKRHGYNYEHCFSFDWKAMKGYHYLMRLAHAVSVLTQYSGALLQTVGLSVCEDSSNSLERLSPARGSIQHGCVSASTPPSSFAWTDPSRHPIQPLHPQAPAMSSQSASPHALR